MYAGVYAYICIHVYMHVCRAYISIYIYIYICICVYMYIYVYLYVYMYTCQAQCAEIYALCIYIYEIYALCIYRDIRPMYIHICSLRTALDTYTYIHIYIHIYTYIHICIYIYIYTYIRPLYVYSKQQMRWHRILRLFPKKNQSSTRRISILIAFINSTS